MAILVKLFGSTNALTHVWYNHKRYQPLFDSKNNPGAARLFLKSVSEVPRPSGEDLVAFWLITARQRSCGKVMFSQVSVHGGGWVSGSISLPGGGGIFGPMLQGGGYVHSGG